jgi:hypothetical protein
VRQQVHHREGQVLEHVDPRSSGSNSIASNAVALARLDDVREMQVAMALANPPRAQARGPKVSRVGPLLVPTSPQAGPAAGGRGKARLPSVDAGDDPTADPFLRRGPAEAAIDRRHGCVAMKVGQAARKSVDVRRRRLPAARRSLQSAPSAKRCMRTA